MIKNKRGITLIALIVTIIVLLILAGISIAMLTGDNGIFSMAKEAKTKNEEAEAREKLEIELTNFVAEKNTNKEYNENEYIDNKLEEKGMTVIEDIVLVDGWQFQIDRNIPKILKSIGKENIIKYEWEKLIKEGKTADEIVNNVELLNRVLEKEEDIEYILKHTEDIMPVVVKSKIAMEYIGKRKDICDKIFGNAQENIESNTNWINAILNNSNAIAGLDSSNPITVPNMTGYTTPSGEAKASSEYQATSNYAWRAFNDSTEVDVSSWHSAEDQLLPQWIQYKFDKPVLVYKFYMQNRNQKTTWVNAPKDFVLLGSNDEKNWDTLGTYQNTNFQKLVGQIYMVQKIDKKYTYYRINVLTARRTDGTTATPYTAIGRIQFYCK